MDCTSDRLRLAVQELWIAVQSEVAFLSSGPCTSSLSRGGNGFANTNSFTDRHRACLNSNNRE